MSIEEWDETGKLWDDDHGLLDPDQIGQCSPADAGEPFRSPVPTQIVSNGEYLPEPQTGPQRSVQTRIAELADSASRKLGISRRQFLTSGGGMAAAFLAMNDVYGAVFNVDGEELLDTEARAAHGPPRDLFVFDDQLHFVRGTRSADALRAIAQGPSSAPTFDRNPHNPAGLLDEQGEPDRPERPGLMEGLQHLLRGQSGQRSEQPDAAMAARRRGGRLPHVRADRKELPAAQGPQTGTAQHLRTQGAGPRTS